MATYEMFWDCDACGTEKLLGLSHRHCPSCGAVQDPARRYFPSEAEKVAVEDHRFVGADRQCPACDSPNAANAGFCVNCGSDLDAAKGVGTLGQVAEGGQAGARAPRKAAPAPPAAEAPSTAGRAGLLAGGGMFGCFGLTVVGVLLVMTLICVSAFWTKPTSLAVTGHTWERKIPIERLEMARDTAWCDKVPSGAKEISRTEKERSTKKVPDGETCSTVNVDNGDGTFRKEEKCKPKTREIPVMDDFCTYEAEKWVTQKTERAGGQGLAPGPSWPVVRVDGCKNLGCTREGSRSEANTVLLREDDGTAQSCDVPSATWARMAVGSRWVAPKRMIGGGLDCSGLTPAP